jgi:hypothetical protein
MTKEKMYSEKNAVVAVRDNANWKNHKWKYRYNMKQLITALIFVTSSAGLFGQSIPVVIAGKMYVNATVVRSNGAVQIYASDRDTGRVNIAAPGSKLHADTIIFYSNDTNDGLLLNAGGAVKGATGIENPKAVILRKKFERGIHTYLSLPFDVTNDDIYLARTKTKLINGENTDWQFVVFEFNYKQRAETGSRADSIAWTEMGILSSDSIKYDGLKKGVGYQFYLREDSLPFVDSKEVDFYATPSDIAKLFDSSEKTLTYPAYGAKAIWSKDDRGKVSGWACIGGLNFSTFEISRSTLADYQGSVIYVQDRENGEAMSSQSQVPSNWKAIVLANEEAAKVGPYTPFFIQSPVEDNLVGAVEDKTLVFKNAGLSLLSVEYRSSQDESGEMDQLYFALSSDKDNAFDRLYLNFAENYEDFFHPTKDGLKMNSYENKPTVWSLRNEASLVVSGLPTASEGVEVQIGFSVPYAGDYTISLEPLYRSYVQHVVLVDNQTKAKVDLLQYSTYSFYSEQVKSNSGRFVLYVNSAFPIIPEDEKNAPFAYVKDNMLTVRNLGEGDKVQVFDLTGSTIASGKAVGREFSVPLRLRGVYIVNTGATILKVLN